MLARVPLRARALKSQQRYQELNSKEEEQEIYRIAKARDRVKRDCGDTIVIKSDTDQLPTIDKKICDKWQGYFQTLLNAENERQGVPEVDRVEGPEKGIKR